MMKKKLMLVPVAAALAVFLAAVLLWQRPEPPVKSLLLITLDTMRADRLGCYNDPLARTPAIDALARQGILFENCYTPVPLTLPAHCSLLTGRWPLSHGVRNNGSYKLPGAALTLAEKLSFAGYDTGALVASYVLKGKFGLDQGFDLYDDRLGTQEKSGTINAEITADRVYDKFKRWLERKHDKPFFLWVHFFDPHMPYDPPAAYRQAANGDAYRGEVAYMDHYVGRLLADLRTHGLWKNTLVVVAGDHGEAFGEHGEKGHGIFCYEQSMKVPLIIAGPALAKKPARIIPRARLVDVMPTILELLGTGAAETCQGESLAKLMAGAPEKTLRPVYLESMYGWEMNNWARLTGLISGPYKYISLPQAELYDLHADPGETANIFFKKNLLARRLDRELAAFVKDHLPEQGQDARSSLQTDEKRKLAALGYISSFAATGQAGTDPKIGIRYQLRYIELVAALDRGETSRVEAEALRLRAETAAMKFPFAYVLLNFVYEKKQQWDKVEANLLQACEIFKDSPAQALTFRGNLMEFYFAKGDLAAAEEMAALVLRSDPGHERVLEILGEIREKRQDWPGALGWYLKAQKNDAENAALAKKVIQMRLKTGDRKLAFSESESLLRTEAGAQDTDLMFTAAMLAIEAGNGARAEELLRRLTEIQPTGPRWFDYALVLGRNGKLAEAIIVMEKALAAPPKELDNDRRKAAARALTLWRARSR